MTASRPGDLLQWPRIMLEYLRERREKRARRVEGLRQAV